MPGGAEGIEVGVRDRVRGQHQPPVGQVPPEVGIERGHRRQAEDGREEQHPKHDRAGDPAQERSHYPPPEGEEPLDWLPSRITRMTKRGRASMRRQRHGSRLNRCSHSSPRARIHGGARRARPEMKSKLPPTPMPTMAPERARLRASQASSAGEPYPRNSNSAPLERTASVVIGSLRGSGEPEPKPARLPARVNPGYRSRRTRPAASATPGAAPRKKKRQPLPAPRAASFSTKSTPGTRSGRGWPSRRAAHSTPAPSASARSAPRSKAPNAGSRPACMIRSGLTLMTRRGRPSALARAAQSIASASAGGAR